MAFAPVREDHFPRYAAAMAKSLAEKLFFAPHVDADVFVDFGCADGALLEGLATLKPGAALIGYDLDELALRRARARLGAHPAARTGNAFFSDWDALAAHLERLRAGRPLRICLIVSSVLHEVYAYGGEAEGLRFWQRVSKGPFSDVVLRDMCISEHEMAEVDTAAAARVRRGADDLGLGAALAEFEALWGSIARREALVHFLLKYRYQANWSRELAENYLPITLEQIMDFCARDFDAEMFDHAALPFLEGEVARDFGLSFPCATHLKAILRRS